MFQGISEKYKFECNKAKTQPLISKGWVFTNYELSLTKDQIHLRAALGADTLATTTLCFFIHLDGERHRLSLCFAFHAVGGFVVNSLSHGSSMFRWDYSRTQNF